MFRLDTSVSVAISVILPHEDTAIVLMQCRFTNAAASPRWFSIVLQPPNLPARP